MARNTNPEGDDDNENQSCWSRHFRIKHLTLYHEEPIVFIVSQWQRNKTIPNIWYLLYRAIRSIYLLVTFCIAYSARFFLYLTDWGYTVLLIEAWVGFIMLLVSSIGTNWLKNHHWQFYMLKFHSFYWWLHVTAISLGFVISVAYWTLVAIYAGDTNYAEPGSNMYVHAYNSIVLFIDLCVVHHPVKIMHFVYPVVFGFSYTIFSVAYYFYDTNRGGKGYVYPILDWAKPGVATVVTIGMFVLMIVTHFFTYLIQKLRIHVHHRVVNKSYDMSSTHSPTDDEQTY